MKKAGLWVFAVLAVFAFATAFTGTGTSVTSSVPGPKGIPDSVFNIIENSCTDCHSTDGNGMARSKINFDKWDSYSPEKQASKAEAMCKMLNKGAMPPGNFRKNNPDRVPTAEQVKMICDWAQTVGK
jgi:hypothetical protein